MSAQALGYRRHEHVDYRHLVQEYPPPPEFFSAVYTQWDRERIRRVQEARLRTAVERAWNVPFYQRLWRAAGVQPGDVRTLEDLRHLPVYTVEDYRASLEEYPPFGDYLARVPGGENSTSLRIFTSGGTTGRARPMVYAPYEWEVYVILLARDLYLHGLREGEVVQIPMTFGLHIGAFAVYHAAVDWLGCTPVTTSSGLVTPTQRQLELLREWGASLIIGFPDYMLHLAHEARKLGLDPRTDFPRLRILSVAGDPRPVRDTWGKESYDFFGANEYGMIGAQCKYSNGLHIWEDVAIVEVLDVDTGEPITEPGRVGNLVVTALYKETSPVIRFNTRDLTRLMPEERCACGSWFRRIDHHLGRSDGMIRLRGVNVWPEACGEVVRRQPGFNGQYYCILERKGDPPRDNLLLQAEAESADADFARLKADLEEALRRQLEVRIEVEVVPPMALQPKTRYGIDPKIRRFEDRRSKVAPAN